MVLERNNRYKWPYRISKDSEAFDLNRDTKYLSITAKGPCATLMVCRRAVLSERANKPYMDCKQHENIGKAMAANDYVSSV